MVLFQTVCVARICLVAGALWLGGCAAMPPSPGSTFHGEFGGLETVASYRSGLRLRPGDVAYDWPASKGVRNLAARGIGEQEVAEGRIALVRCALGTDSILWWHARIPPGVKLNMGDYLALSAGSPWETPGPLSLVRSVIPAPERSDTYVTHGRNTIRCTPR